MTCNLSFKYDNHVLLYHLINSIGDDSQLGAWGLLMYIVEIGSGVNGPKDEDKSNPGQARNYLGLGLGQSARPRSASVLGPHSARLRLAATSALGAPCDQGQPRPSPWVLRATKTSFGFGIGRPTRPSPTLTSVLGAPRNQGHSLDSGSSVNRNRPLYLCGPRTASNLGTLRDKGQPQPRPQPWLLHVTKASHGLDLGCSVQSRLTSSTLALDAQHNQGRPRPRYWAPRVTKATASTQAARSIVITHPICVDQGRPQPWALCAIKVDCGFGLNLGCST
nr:hypothetical protein Iba_chr02bCG6780 [Ipomoea batatas]